MGIQSMARAVLTAAVAAGLLTGCGTGDEQAGGKSTAGASSASADSRKAKLDRFMAAKGLVVAECSNVDWTISVLDPANGAVRADFNLGDYRDWLAQVAPKASSPAPCGLLRSLSPDGRRLAIRVEESPTKVGWIDLTSGKFTDVTALGKSSGFTTENNSDEIPTFAPDGTLWFIRNGKPMRAGPDGKAAPGKLTRACFSGDTLQGEFQVTAQGVATSCRTVHPSGRFAASAQSDQGGLRLQLLTPPGEADDTGYTSYLPRPKSAVAAIRTGSRPYSCRAALWIDAGTLLCGGATPGDRSSVPYRTVPIDPSRVTADAKITGLNAGPVVIPATDQTVHFVWPGPDGKELILAAADQGQPTALYRTSLTTPGEPQKIGPLTIPGATEDPTFEVIGWR